MAQARRTNGLAGFSLHSARSDDSGIVTALGTEMESNAFGIDADSPAATDPETAARRYLAGAMASPAKGTPNMPKVAKLTGDFRLLGTETVELTGTKSVKFRQAYNKIPVYGSLVTVELDETNGLIGISSSLGAPEKVEPIAEISPADALRTIEREGADAGAAEAARTLFYFDDRPDEGRWRLCYLFENVPLRLEAASGEAIMPIFNYLVDAHDGTLVSRVSRIAGIEEVEAMDELQVLRRLRVSADAEGHRRLHDPVANVHTYDLQYRDWHLHRDALTSDYCKDPPELSRAAVSAHANAAAVIEFLSTVLKRRGIDNLGSPLTSTINCLYWRHPAGEGEWLNAAWIGTQMVYGQRRAGEGLMSTSADLDVVAHEIAHGLIQNTADLEYRDESGALNESYGDIFGILVANRGAERSEWDYRIGRNFRSDGRPLRDIGNPGLRGHPGHMRDWLNTVDDHGGVHTNSAIHNKAAHNIMIATDIQGPVFSEDELAAIFYLALTQHLSRTSGFSDSRRGVEAAVLTLFRARPRSEIEQRLDAVRGAFDAVGVA